MAAAVGTDSLVHAELLAACSSLGYSDGVHYHREADCLETTKDLLRYLRRDDDSHEVRLALGDTRVLQTDLLPLLQEHGNDDELLQLLVRLLVDLTNPALLLFREELPEEKVTRRKFLQLVTQQQEFKEAFTKQRAWEALASRVGQLLEVPPEDRDEDQRLLLERILVLVRNVLSAPASADEGRTDDDASTHDQVLWAMHMGGLADLLLYLATTPAEHRLALHVLEVVSLMLREQDAAQLATAGLGSSEKERQAESRQLEELRRREALQQESRRRAAPSRHSRFGGTYVVRNVKGVGDNDLILHQPCADGSQRSFDRHKRPKKYNKNRVPLKQTDTTRRSTLAVRLFLQEFCVEFLAGAYNGIMAAVKDALDRARAQDHDETYYLWAMRFFMEFNRHHNFRVEYVTETLSIHTFHFIQTHIENFFEMMAAEKKKVALWSRRMHRALRAYQELLATLAHMDRSPSHEVRESSRVLKSRVFYVVEYREMMLLLLQNYDPVKMSLSYLRDAVEATHIFLKLLEGFCGRGRHVIVQGKARRAAQRKAKAAKAATATAELTPQQLQEQWEVASLEVSAAVQGEAGELPLMVPFDPLSEEPEDTQKEMAMRRISRHLQDKEYPQAVALLRAARDVWPEGDVFGPQAADHTQDFLTLQEVFMANLTPPQGAPAPEEVNEEELEEEEEEEEERMAVMTEQEFDLDAFIRRFANTKVIRAYSRLLDHYPTNTTHTNHCILKLFHRLAWDVKLPAIFFQASLFIVFLRAMEDPLRNTLESPREIAKFAKYIMRQLYKVAETNPKVYVEMLFWKTNKDALEIECGYGEQESGKQAAKQAWREEEEEELRHLHEEVTDIPEDERDGKDTVDLILDRLISRSRTRRSVIKKLKELGLIQNIRDLQQRAPRIRAPRTWTEEEEEELRTLFQENREAMDIVGRIMDGLTIRRPKHRVVEKILELGLVADRKELRKKRPKNPSNRKQGKKSGEDFLRANEGSDDEEDDNDDQSNSEEEEEEDDKSNNRQGATRHQPPPPSDPIATPALISQALGVVLESGRREAVEWLAGILNDVADDREEDGDFEPVPILAITQICTDAMDDDAFQKLLRLLGIRPPMSHQEMFWRLPSNLSVAALRKRAEYLKQGVEGGLLTLENPDEPLEPVEEVVVMEDAPMKVKKPKKNKDVKPKPPSKKKRERKSSPDIHSPFTVDDGDGDNDTPSSSVSKTKAPSTGKKKKERKGKKGQSTPDIPSSPYDNETPSTSSQAVGVDSSEDEAPLSSLAARPDPSSEKKAGKRVLSEEESDDDGKIIKRKKEKKKKRVVLDSDSEEEKEDMGEEVTKMPREEEEEEEELVISQATKKQRRRAVISSDDEDE
ncbi:protein timeless homolog [Eriocheir sinensis]|uniref:protein timeless homolog n=1 Tax=Eriocheir sinensis TaxID=95602 RepID=UPI0021C9573E|nr:protein timeless homolog [Eriocheir sinensis]